MNVQDEIQTEFDTEGHNVKDADGIDMGGGILLSNALAIAEEADKYIAELTQYPDSQIPPVLFDGYAVYTNLPEEVQKDIRDVHVNALLDSVVDLIRKERGKKEENAEEVKDNKTQP